MTQVRTPEFAAILARPPRRVAPRVEDAVRVAAATLAHALPELIMSTSVVLAVGADDLDALCQLVREIADAHGLDAAINAHVGWCKVRFSR